MTLTIIILIATVAMFVMGRVRADIVALCALALLLLCGILTPAEALAGFSNQVVIMMAGLFVVGGAILQTGLAKAASQRIMHVAGNNATAMFLLVVLVTAAIGAFVSNTGTVALMMPIVVSMAAQTGRNASGLLMPLAFASSMGGMLTLIGTPPNLVIDETLQGHGMEGLSFFSFLPVGLICLAVGILVMLPLSRIFLNKKTHDKAEQGKTAEQLVDEYKLAGNIYAFRVNARSSVVGRTARQLNLRAKHGISIIEIRQDSSRHGKLLRNITQQMPLQDQQMQGGDILYLQGAEEDVRQFASAASLHPLSHSGLDFFDIGIAEIVVMPESRLVGLTLRDSQLREQYQINVLGVRRSHAYISDQLPELRLKAGDTLLIQGLWTNLEKIDQEENGWVLLGKPKEMAERVTIGYRAPLAALIMVLMVAAMVFDFIPVQPVTAVMVAGLLMVVTGCLRSVDAAYKTINWESLVLIAAMMPMATALEKTGVSAIVSHSLVAALGSLGPTALLCGVYFTTSLLTMFISNTATAVLMAPISMSAASELSVSPLPFLFAVTLGASMCFASPFSTPPNALVMQAGGYSFADYVKVGLPLQLIMGVVMTLVLPLLFPF
ncbi:MAG: SLC13 family permease [Bacteroidaceae bacterium]